MLMELLFLSDEVIPNYGAERDVSNELVGPRGDGREKRISNLTSSPRDALLQSSSSLSSSLSPSISGGFNSTIVQDATINTIITTTPNYIISTTVATTPVML